MFCVVWVSRFDCNLLSFIGLGFDFVGLGLGSSVLADDLEN